MISLCYRFTLETVIATVIYFSVKILLLIIFAVISDEGRKPLRSFYPQVVRTQIVARNSNA